MEKSLYYESHGNSLRHYYNERMLRSLEVRCNGNILYYYLLCLPLLAIIILKIT